MKLREDEEIFYHQHPDFFSISSLSLSLSHIIKIQAHEFKLKRVKEI